MEGGESGTGVEEKRYARLPAHSERLVARVSRDQRYQRPGLMRENSGRSEVPPAPAYLHGPGPDEASGEHAANGFRLHTVRPDLDQSTTARERFGTAFEGARRKRDDWLVGNPYDGRGLLEKRAEAFAEGRESA